MKFLTQHANLQGGGTLTQNDNEVVASMTEPLQVCSIWRRSTLNFLARNDVLRSVNYDMDEIFFFCYRLAIEMRNNGSANLMINNDCEIDMQLHAHVRPKYPTIFK